MPASPQQNGRIKGAILREFLCWYQIEVGLEVFAERFGGFGGPLDSSQKGCGVLPSTWYDVTEIHPHLDAMSRAHPDDELREIVTRGTHVSLTKTLTTLHRAIIRSIASPFLHSRFAQVLWSAHYDTGKVLSERTGEREQRITYSDWLSHHPVICLMTSVSDEVIFPMMGLRGVQVTRAACVSEGDAACTHIVTWSR